MTTTGPRIRDYTGGTRDIVVEVSVSAAYEVLLQMFTVQNRNDAATEEAATEEAPAAADVDASDADENTES